MQAQEKKVEAAVEVIEYMQDDEFGEYGLTRRPDGLWEYVTYSAVQGELCGLVVLLRAPSWLDVEDKADLDTDCDGETKAECLIEYGQEVRIIRRGFIVQ